MTSARESTLEKSDLIADASQLVGSAGFAEGDSDPATGTVVEPKPAEEEIRIAAASEPAAAEDTRSLVEQAISTPAPNKVAAAVISQESAPAETTETAEAETAPAEGATAPVQVATAAPVEVAPQPEKRGLLSALFGNRAPRPARAIVNTTQSTPIVVASAAAAPAPVLAETRSAAPVNAASASALPGVNAESLFEIKRKSGGYDDSDVDINEEELPVRVASVTGLARLAPNGLALQREDVDVGCLKPALLRALKSVERHYGRKVVVTSGYRSPKHNRKVRGARNSLHMYCAAADIQVAGVDKWQLASYLRSMPGRGGVGTYCHTDSVHIDIGPERDWNWRCRRKKKR